MARSRLLNPAQRSKILFAAAVTSMLVLVSCASAPIPQTSLIQEPLAEPFRDVFVAEFEDKKESLKAWGYYGGAVLMGVERTIYPPVRYDEFEARALARIRQVKTENPDISPILLSYVALDGLAELSPDTPAHHTRAVVVTENGAGLRSIIGSIGKPPERDVPPPSAYYPNAEEYGVPALHIPELKQGSLPSAVRQALADHSGPIVLDLRGNIGGRLESVPRIASLFVESGAGALLMETKGGQIQTIVTDDITARIESTGVLVIIDQDTNTGALTVAATLREYRIAKIAGARATEVNDIVERFSLMATCPPAVRKCGLRVPFGRMLTPAGNTLEAAAAVDYPVDPHNPHAVKAVIEKWRNQIAP